MKYLKFSIIILLLCLVTETSAQIEPKTVFEVRIFKSIGGDFKNRKFILIDSTGNVLSFNKSTGDKIDLKSFNKSISKFVKKESAVRKIPASDTSSELTINPGKGKYNIEVRTVFLEDYRLEKARKSKTHYSWMDLSDEDKLDIFLKYLSKENEAILSKYLK